MYARCQGSGMLTLGMVPSVIEVIDITAQEGDGRVNLERLG